MKGKMLLFGLFFGILSLCCKESTGLERNVHPENWITLHKEKVKNIGENWETLTCLKCHPPQGDWPDAPPCSECHEVIINENLIPAP